MGNNPVPPPGINFGQAPTPLTVDYAPRRVLMFYASEPELNELAKSGNSLNWVFFGICAGGLFSFLSVFASADIPNARTYAAFVAVTLVLGIGALFFGINGYRDHKEIEKTLTRIKSQ